MYDCDDDAVDDDDDDDDDDECAWARSSVAQVLSVLRPLGYNNEVGV